MSWLGNCTRCGQPTVSTKDPGYRDEDYVVDVGGGVRHVWCPVGRAAPVVLPDLGFARVPVRKIAVPRSRGTLGGASPIEQKFWDACRRLALPELDGLVFQHPVHGYRIDFALPATRTGIELDGFAAHSSTADIARDRRRQRILEGHGWHIIRFGGAEVHHDAEGCARQAAFLIARRGTHNDDAD